jgi:hypothetical protein
MMVHEGNKEIKTNEQHDLSCVLIHMWKRKQKNYLKKIMTSSFLDVIKV